MKKFILIFTLFISACSSQFSAYRANPDNFNPGVEHYFSSDIEFQENTFGGPGVGTFKINSYVKNDNITWALSTLWISSYFKWLFINDIAFNIDGKIINATTQGIPTREVTALGVVEKNHIPVTDELIKLLSKANSVIVRVSGANYYVERTLTPEDVKNIRWYISYINQGNKPTITK